MAAISSNGTGGGNWSATSTWSGGIVPVSGTDTVTIVSGDTVNVDSAAESGGQLIVGSDPGTGGTAAITISSTTAAASLNVNAGVVLRLRGDLTFSGSNASAYSTLNAASGSSVIFDPPSAAHYVTNVTGTTRFAINLNGATNTGNWPDTAGGNHVIWKADLTRGGTNTYCTNVASYTFNGGFFTVAFAEISNAGISTGGTFGVMTCFLGSQTATCSHTNSTFTNSNYTFNCDNTPNTSIVYTFNNNIVTSCVNQPTGYGINNNCVIFTLKGSPTVPPQVMGNSFDATSLVTLDGMTNAQIQNNVFAGGVQVNSGNYTGSPDQTYINNNFLAWGLTGSINGVACKFGNSKNNYFFNKSVNVAPLAPAVASTISGCVFEFNSTVSSSVCIQPLAANVTILNCLSLPNSTTAGASPPLIFLQTLTGLTVEHCMWFAGTDSFGNDALIQLQGTNTANAVASCRANIIYFDSATANVSAIREITAFNTLDAVTLAGYNAFKNPHTGTCEYNAGGSSVSLVGYDGLKVTNATPFAAQGGGAGNTQIQSGFDFTADPQFADQTYRGLARWGGTTAGGGTATVTAAIAQLLANPALVAQPGTGLIPWVKAGYIPKNAAFANATYSGDATTTDALGNPQNGTVGPLGYSPPGPWPFFYDTELSGGLFQGSL